MAERAPKRARTDEKAAVQPGPAAAPTEPSSSKGPDGGRGGVAMRGLAQHPPPRKVAMLDPPEQRKKAPAPAPAARGASSTRSRTPSLGPPSAPPSRASTPPTGPAPPLARPSQRPPLTRRHPPQTPLDPEDGELPLMYMAGQPPAPPQATGATARLHLAALSGLLWHHECQQLHQQQRQQPQHEQQQASSAERAASGALASTSAPGQQRPQQQQQQQQRQQQQQVPNNFVDVHHYVSVFEPLLHDEARGALVNAYEEAQNAGKGWLVKVEGVEQRGGGWFTASVFPMPGRQGQRIRHKEFVRKDSIVVLCKVAPAATGAETYQQYGSRGRLLRMACIVRMSRPQLEDPLTLSFHPACPHHDAQDRDSPCMQALKELLDHPFGWTLVPAGSLVTNEREAETLGRVGQGAYGPMRDLLPMLLNPGKMAAQCDGQIAEEWPYDFGDPGLMDGFFRWLATAYDLPQRQAIVNASSHLCPPQQLENSPVPVLPFTLIQGPPGTGKTHTVKGILNAWHVVGYRRYHESWRQEAARQLAIIQASSAWDRRRSALEALDMLQPAVPKPRVLVCAPSNAATDELCERILKEGFRDLTTQFTFPDVARVGSEDAAMAESVKEVWTERRVQWHLNCSVEEYRMRFFQAEQRKMEAEMALERLLGRLDTAVAASKVQGTEDALLQLAGQMVDLQDARARAMLEHHRLNIVAPRFLPDSRFSERMAREELELSLMEHAELVFTTLSSTGRNVFGRLTRRHFDAVLIDEACQAAEVSTLQPLVHGTKKVVMVGDPKQLPATLFSRSARDVLLERSLFERMAQSGVPVKLLAVQYRMHPEIRAFPSKFFYDDALQDAPQVVNQPPAPFYANDILKPYVVFDVQHGAETSGQAGRSKINVAEARLAAGLYWELRCEMMDVWAAHRQDPSKYPEPPRIEVGIVTPYKSQRDLLRRVFADLLGPEAASEVRIETVDSFQGKQLDVIILSCVRATPSGGHGSIGFLSDTRRMNVAITRAKRSLWVLGHAASLRQHHVWRELLQDAQDRGCVVEEANGDDPTLLPRFAELVRQKGGSTGHPPAPPLSLPMGLAAAPPAAAIDALLHSQHQAPLSLQPQPHLLPPHPQQPPHQLPQLQPLLTQQQQQESQQHHAPLHMPTLEGNLHPPAALQPSQPQQPPQLSAPQQPSAPLHNPQQRHQQQQQYPLLQRQLQLLQQEQQQQGTHTVQPPAMYSNGIQQSLLLGLPLQTTAAQGPQQLQHQHQQQPQ